MLFHKIIVKSLKVLLISQLILIKSVACDRNATSKSIDFLSIKPRIVAGYRPPKQSLAKYAVSLRSRKESANQFGYTHFCGGSILTSNKILTAAHCLFSMGKRLPASSLKVVAKTPKRLNQNLISQEINVKEVIVHANYKDSTLFNDIALLILEDDIELDPEFAAVIPLPTAAYEAGTLCEVVGWGRLYMFGPLANEIVQVDLHVHSRQYCRRRYPYFSSKKICASNLHDTEKDACSGDSGGPMICGGVLTGIVSYGTGCNSGRAGIYTNVFMYLDWIARNEQDLLKPFIKILHFLETAASPNATRSVLIQPDIASSSLRAAYRLTETEINSHLTKENFYCSQSLAKFMVSIRKLETDKNFGHRHVCGGVIVRSNLILTAAHCLISNRELVPTSSIRVVAKTPIRLRKTLETQVMRVKKIIPHDMWLTAFKVDLALLKLRHHITFDKNCALAVRLPERSINGSDNCTVLGWGKLYLNGPLANEILQLNVTLHSKEFCAPYFLDANASKLCASDRRDNEKHPCSGDSGGPLFCEGFLTGIVSYGFQCSRSFPTVYTDVYEHRNWIKANNTETLKILNMRVWLIVAVVIAATH